MPFVTFKPDNLESIGNNHKKCRTRHLNSRGSYVVITYVWHEFHKFQLEPWQNKKKCFSECPCCVHSPLFLRIAVTEGQTPKKLYSAFQICRGLILEPQKSYKRLRLGHVKSLERDHWRGHKIFFMVQHEIRMYDCCQSLRVLQKYYGCAKKLLLRILCQFYFTIKIGALSFFANLIGLIKPLFFCRRKLFSLRGFAQIWETLKKNGYFIQCDQKSSFLFKFILSHNYLFQSGTIFFG